MLIPALGEAYSAVLEGGAVNAHFSHYDALANVPTVTRWPVPAADFVMRSVLDAGSPGPFLALNEGISFHRPPTGQTIEDDGAFTFAGFVVPNPTIGLDLTEQAIYLDATPPFGFCITWEEWPNRL